jgi:hypothetical protein
VDSIHIRIKGKEEPMHPKEIRFKACGKEIPLTVDRE